MPSLQPVPPITNADAALDASFFAANPQRTCYARRVGDEWTLVIKRVVSKRAPPVMLRLWAYYVAVPNTEAECLKLWDDFAW